VRLGSQRHVRRLGSVTVPVQPAPQVVVPGPASAQCVPHGVLLGVFLNNAMYRV
jgi:hypothetical protein